MSPLAKPLLPRRNREREKKKITSSSSKLCKLYSFCILKTLAKVLISEICPVRRLVPAWFLILIAK